MREHYEKQIAILEDRIALMERGDMQTKVFSADNPNWIDTTAGTIEIDKRTVADLRAILEKFYPEGERLKPSE